MKMTEKIEVMMTPKMKHDFGKAVEKNFANRSAVVRGMIQRYIDKNLEEEEKHLQFTNEEVVNKKNVSEEWMDGLSFVAHEIRYTPGGKFFVAVGECFDGMDEKTEYTELHVETEKPLPSDATASEVFTSAWADWELF